MAIELTSSLFDQGGPIPHRHARSVENISPPLAWSGVPEGTVELVLLLQDPDAPSGTFTHWILARLRPDLDRLDEGEVPEGALAGTNDFGEVGYGGPQPPDGDPPHRYVFTLLALGERTSLAPGFSVEELHDEVQGTELGRGQLTGLYRR